jgi:signal transduction histidine kinase
LKFADLFKITSILQHLIIAVHEARERFFRRFRDRVYPTTFVEEINEQCDIFFPLYASPFFVAWLPYLSLDPLLLPNEPLMPFLRVGLSLVGVIALCARYLWKNPKRHRLIGNGMMYYLIVVTGIITGLAKAHPSYVGGYCFLITVLGAMPVQPSQLFSALAVSLSVFAGLCWHFNVSFAEPALRYSLQDLISTVSVSVLMSYGWTMLRRNSYEKGRALQEMNAQIQAQQETLADQNESLRHLNMEKDELIGIVSHDLRNPITAILGIAEIVQEEDSALSAELRSDMLGRIHHSALQMRMLIDHLLNADAIENGALKPNFVYVSVLEVVANVVESLQTQAEKKAIFLQIEGSANVIVYADILLVGQVMENLISNAIKYSPSETQVLVSFQRCGEMVQIAVKDEGPGLSENDKMSLFKKFARLSAQPTGGEQSTGLGLSIVKKMVEVMNGKVWCESEQGQGATFIVELPSASVSKLSVQSF